MAFVGSDRAPIVSQYSEQLQPAQKGTFHGVSTDGNISIIDASVFFRLPALETFQIAGGHDVLSDVSQWKYALGSSPVSVIRVSDCRMCLRTIGALLCSSKALKSFALTDEAYPPVLISLGPSL